MLYKEFYNVKYFVLYPINHFPHLSDVLLPIQSGQYISGLPDKSLLRAFTGKSSIIRNNLLQQLFLIGCSGFDQIIMQWLLKIPAPTFVSPAMKLLWGILVLGCSTANYEIVLYCKTLCATRIGKVEHLTLIVCSCKNNHCNQQFHAAQIFLCLIYDV